MKERKLYKALESLHTYEQIAFRKFLQSPFFNVNNYLINLYEFLEQKLRSGTDLNTLAPDIIWKASKKEEPFSEVKLRKMLSDLLALFEAYMAQTEFQKRPSLELSMKLEAIRKKGIDGLYNGLINDIARLHRSELNQSADYYINRYLIERNLFQFTNENEKKTSKSEINKELNINEISRNLDYFYIAEKLKYYCTLLSWQKMYKVEQQLDNMDFIIQCAELPEYKKIPPIAIYKKIYDTFNERENVGHYEELKELIDQHVHQFPPEETREIYYTAISYCIEKVNKGNLDFQNETFEIYKSALTQDVLLVDNHLSPSDFRNIVFFALRVGQYQWAEYFIENYARYIEEKYRDNAVHFSLARLDFYRKDYRKVIAHLMKVNYEDVWYNLGSRTLLISSYYELDEFDALESLLQAFRMYIDREKSLSKERKQSYINLIRFTKKLIQINPREKEKLNKLHEEILAAKNVVVKPWLIEKIDELV